MEKYNLQLTHHEIFENFDDPKLVHEIDGVKVEVECEVNTSYDNAGEEYEVDLNSTIIGAEIGGNSHNVYSRTPDSYENHSGVDKFDELMEEGAEFEDACEQAGAEWIVNIGDYIFAYIPKSID